jgi:hypothetical protein
MDAQLLMSSRYRSVSMKMHTMSLIEGLQLLIQFLPLGSE